MESHVTVKIVTKDIDLTGKTCLITGGNSGIGLEVTRCLASRNCSILMACRNPYEADGVIKQICDKHELFHFYKTNLASLDSVKNASDEILQSHKSSSICLLSKRFISIIPSAKNVIGGCWNVLEKSIDFIKILGPTADEVTKDIDLTGKTCLITGGNSGIGLEVTRCLASRNCSILMACRNPYEADGVIKQICDKHELFHFYKTNLASLDSVKNASDEILQSHKKIDIVILNAGVFGLPWTLTDDGLETTFQVNYLSQYYLLTNIETALASNARVVFISSESHRNINWTLNNVLAPNIQMFSLPKDEYTSIRAYNVSKLCGILAMHYLAYRWLNTSKQVFCAHPGSFVKTKLCRNWWVYEALYTFMKPFSKSIAQAASTPIYCATSPDLKGMSGLYFKNCERCDESELAQDFQLSFRVQDLTYELLRNKTADVDEKWSQSSTEYREQRKHADHDTLISDYSG